MNSTQHNRALVASHLLRQVATFPDRVGATSYELAMWLDCTPQTVTNTLMKYGRRFGISYHEQKHRPHVTKRVWYVDENTSAAQFYKAVAKSRYMTYFWEGHSDE